jgi:hypothetical protein
MKEDGQILSNKKIWIERNKRHKGSLFKAIAPRALVVR